MPLITKGFESVQQLNRHFGEHGTDFRASNANEYEAYADAFLGGPKPVHVLECVRACGAIVRYDPNFEAFGVLDDGRVCRTYFVPVPCSSLPGAIRAAQKLAGRCHPHANNLVYFKAECKK
jgi:pyocin large subunit-like protein